MEYELYTSRYPFERTKSKRGKGVGELEKRDALSNSVNTKLLEVGKNGQGLENCIHFDLDGAGRYGLYHFIRETLGNRLMLVQLW